LVTLEPISLNASRMQSAPPFVRHEMGPLKGSGASVAQTLLWAVFAALVVARVCISNNLLNLWISYSTQGGTIIEKVHPAAGGLFALAAMLAPRIAAVKDGRKILNAMFTLAVAICLASVTPLIGTGTISAGVGYLIDSVFCACAASSILLSFARPYRHAFGQLLLNILIINGVIALVEFALKMNFISYGYDYGQFRSVALYSHPLVLGLLGAAAIPFVSLTHWSALRKACSIIILICATLAAGARAASIAATVALLILVFANSGPSAAPWKAKLIVLAGLPLLLPVAWIIVDAMGLAERFQQIGLVDKSTMARISILNVFDLLNGQDLWWGIGAETLTKLTSQGLRMDSVENSIVVYVFQFGIIGSVFLIAALLYAFYVLGRGAQLPVKLGLLVFLLVALSNNTLSAKGPALTVIFLLAIAFRSSLKVVHRPRGAVAPAPQTLHRAGRIAYR
jgi:hypothetical protein